ncbi:class I SAM-dependent DNA methyltransferase [[Clostridium] fimetarium]|uniref:Methyltransferase domain-containing protein n=1 Tax=[Clostridium] fimetarium TaxID=99656 RepID=A0A1I0MH61_9FIRM|nr:class I SAM-dependent methyltransferase [[Clostridium] fimetarium]SEV87418.1 Methyltransferase domain-containing protein [[Clostridium] fimetarium]
MSADTLEYYNKNAKDFNDSTFEVDFAKVQEWFCKYLKAGSLILDFGCGSGRDTKYFMERGYRLDAIDGSKELCEIASENTGIVVKNQVFNKLNEVEKYDGIWACASILHLQYNELKEVLVKMNIALNESGILYCSFKYGDFEGDRNGRYFTDMTAEKLDRLIDEIGILEVREQMITTDVRPGRDDEKWLK